MNRANSSVVFLVLLITLCSGSSLAQSTYDDNALRLRTSLFGSKLVSGLGEQQVSKLGLFPSREPVALLEARSEEASRLYLSYRSKQISGSLLYLVGSTAVFVGFFVAGSEEDDGLAAGLLLGGLAVELVGLWRVASGLDDLNRTIWHYNRTLTAPQR